MLLPALISIVGSVAVCYVATLMPKRQLMVEWIAMEWYRSSSQTKTRKAKIAFLSSLKHHPEIAVAEVNIRFEELMTEYIRQTQEFSLWIFIVEHWSCSEDAITYLRLVILKKELTKIGPAPK